MKASELRIGNLVLKHNGEITKVSGQFIADFEKYGNETLMTIPPRPFYTGIPLTSEWLWKFGFQPNPREQRLYIQISEDGWIHYYPGTNEILLATESGYSQFGTRNKIEYVHQLQNLYFALTGEELTIKDDGKKEGKEQQESSRAESPATDSLE